MFNSRGAVWMGHISPQQAPSQQQFAVDTANRIAERPSTIVITRNLDDGTVITMPPQVVRIEVVQSIRDSGENRDALVEVSKQYTVGMGYKGHPTIPNTDVQRADTFYYQNRQYEVQEIIDTLPGRLMFSLDLTP